MQMDEGLDTGDILLQKVCPIVSKETAGTLHDKLAILGGDVLIETLFDINKGTIQKHAQNNELASYAHKISKAEAKIDWSLPAKIIERSVRAFNPKPVSHAVLNGMQMRIWEVEVLDGKSAYKSPGKVIASSAKGIDVTTGDHLIRIHSLQLAGKKVVNAAAFHNGHPHFSSIK
jgi:methionyl-tRNA formyltransferase